MKFEIEEVSVLYPNEDCGVKRKIVIEDDFDILHIRMIDNSDSSEGTISLTKAQMNLLKDSLNVIIKNKLIE